MKFVDIDFLLMVKIYGNRNIRTMTEFNEAQENDMSNMICEDCGCGYKEPCDDCNCMNDSTDPNGSHWIQDTNEALNMQQRLKRSRSAKRNKVKMARGRKRAEKKTATKDVIDSRSRKAARKALFNKFSKGADLSPGRKREIEARLDKPNMKAAIKRLAIKMRPRVKSLEKERKSNRNK